MTGATHDARDVSTSPRRTVPLQPSLNHSSSLPSSPHSAISWPAPAPFSHRASSPARLALSGRPRATYGPRDTRCSAGPPRGGPGVVAHDANQLPQDARGRFPLAADRGALTRTIHIGVDEPVLYHLGMLLLRVMYALQSYATTLSHFFCSV